MAINKNEETHWCRLNDRKIVPYDMLVDSSSKELINKVNSNVFVFIGEGVIYKIYGTVQSSPRQCRFYKYKNPGDRHHMLGVIA